MTSYDNIRLEKGLYATGKSFTAALEALDPSETYKGTALEGLDAYQRQLKRFGIKVGGAGSDVVEKFFGTTEAAALFPEYVARAVRQGMEEADALPRLVATVTQIEGRDYRPLACLPLNESGPLDEASLIPETVIQSQNNLVSLKKRGRLLSASYEAIRFQRLELFTVTLRQIGAYIARMQLRDAVETLLNGDGNGNPAQALGAAGAGLGYADLIALWNSLEPYALNALVAGPAAMAQLLALPEFKDANAGLNFQGTGKMITPIGADLVKCTAVPDGTLLGLDKTCALEMVRMGDVTTEFDKLIDRQTDRVAVTSTAGFAKIFAGASKKLDI